MNKYSKNKKLNAVLTTIEEQIRYAFEDCTKSEIERYKADFPRETDYNIAQYGNLLCYYSDVREMYSDCGYKTTSKMSDDKLWETYRRQVGYVARQILKA